MLIRDVRAPNGDGGLEISLHPEVTVMTGLGPDGQVAIADILAAVIYGRSEGLAGSVELEGDPLPLSEWAAVVGEELDRFDVFLRPSDLPSAASPGSRAVDPAVSDALGMRLEQAQLAVEDARGRLAAASDRRAVAVAGRVAAERMFDGAERAVATSRVAGDHSDQDGHADLVELHDKAAVTLAEAEVAERSAQAALTAAEQERSALAADFAVAEERLDRAVQRRQDLEAARSAHQHAVQDEARQRRRLVEERADAARRAAQRASDAAVAAAEEAERAADAASGLGSPGTAGTDEPLGYEEAVERAEAALGEAEAATAATRAAEAEVQRRAAELDEARSDREQAVEAEGRLGELRARAAALEDELARARAEAALLADFADSNAAPWRGSEPGGDDGAGQPGATADATDGPNATEAAAAALRAEDEARQAERRVAELRDRAGQGAPSSPEERSALIARREELEARRGELGEPPGGEPLAPPGRLEAVAAAADRLRSLPTQEQADRAAELLPRVEAAIATRHQFSAKAAPGWLVDDARDALEQARVQLLRAEEMAKPLRISNEDAAELEVAHQAVTDAEARADRRLSGPLSRRRLEAVLAVEKGILDRIGLSSYGAYLLRTMPIAPDSDAAEKLADARRAMADAEAVWAELQELELPSERAVIEEDEAKVIAAAAAVLGSQRMPDEARAPSKILDAIGAALRDAAEAPGRTNDLVAGLAELVPGEAPEELTALLAHTDQWLAAAREDAARRADHAAQLASIESELAAIASALEAATAPGVDAEELADAERAAALAWEGADAAAAAARDAAGPARPGADPAAGATVAQAARAAAEVDAARHHVVVLEAQLAAAQDALGRAGSEGSPVDVAERRVLEQEAELEQAEAALELARRVADERAAVAAQVIGQVAVAEEQARRAAEEAEQAGSSDAENDPEIQAAAHEEQLARLQADAATAATEVAAATAARVGAELSAAQLARREAAEEVERLRRRLAAADEARRLATELDAAGAALAESRAAELAAEEEVERATAALSSARAELARLGEERAAVQTADLPLRDKGGTEQDDEIYVLSRLANARSVDRFGPVPVILVEPFSRFGPARAAAVRDLLGRMAAAVQIVYLTEDPDVLTWARHIGQHHASVLTFGATAGVSD